MTKISGAFAQLVSMMTGSRGDQDIRGEGISAMADRGPWGGRGGDAGTPDGDAAPGKADGPRGDAPRGDGQRGDGPRNPWLPPVGPRPERGTRGPSLEDFLRRGGGGGGNPFEKMPSFGGFPWWTIALAAIALIWVLTSSIHFIGQQERGVVTTLGGYSRTVGPGPAITAPAPIERLQKVDTGAIRTLAIGTTEGSQENRVLSGDQNIIDMAYDVRWSIAQPERYLFNLDNPDDALRDVAESAMRATVANYNLAQAIGSGRNEIEVEVQRRMQAILDSYRSGVQVAGIAIRQSDPPDEVKEAFNNVNAAKQRSESYRNEARAYAQRVVERARGDTAAFDKVYEQYVLAPEVTRRRMYYETMENILGDVDKTVVESNGVTSYLPLPEVRRSQRAAPAAPAAPAVETSR